MAKSRRRPQPALQSWEADGLLVNAYLEHYRRHEPFRKALDTLYAAHGAECPPLLAGPRDLRDVIDAADRETPVSDWARRYLAHLRHIAEDFGLDRFDVRDPAGGSGGERLIHAWCQVRAMVVMQHGVLLSAASFGTGLSVEGWRPEIGEVVSRDEIPVLGPDGQTVIVVEERREPLLHIRHEARWDPRKETKRAAKSRLLTEVAPQIDAELDRITAEAESLKYRFSDVRPERDRHLRWLFEAVALKKTYGRIALEDPDVLTRSSSVYNRIKPYADQIGIKLGGTR